MTIRTGRVLQLNVKPETAGERGLPKARVETTFLSREGVVGDFNRYRHEEKHGDPDSAVLFLPFETVRALNGEGWPVRPGDLGENVTTSGIDYPELGPPGRWKIGQAVVEMTRACDPCTQLYTLPYVGPARGPEFLRVTLHRRGWYARVLEPGEVHEGDPVAPYH